jgi:23S rRNA (uridine2552-2'-O)-methyltransferase
MNKADLVLSDIAPNITGIENVDQANFVEILESILNICDDLLKKKWSFSYEVFHWVIL